MQPLQGPTVRLAPTTPADADALRAILAEPAVARWWDEPDPNFPLDDDPDAVRLTIHRDGEVAGLIQFFEEPDPKYRHASIDLYVGSAHQRRGIASEAIGLVVEHLVGDRGHHRVTIDPAAANTAAVACYRRAGFRPVGVLRRAERDTGGDGWHDQLLMELVV